MKLEFSKPFSRKNETIYVLLSIISILIVSLFLIVVTKEKKDINEEIVKMSKIETLIHSDLKNFLFELDFFALSEGYPNIKKLEEENLYPFIKNESYDEKINIKWYYINNKNKNYYLGISNNEEISNFLVESYIKDEKVISKIYIYKKELSSIINKDNLVEKLDKYISEFVEIKEN